MKYQDFSKMPPEALRDLAIALAEVGRKALENEMRKRRTAVSLQNHRQDTP